MFEPVYKKRVRPSLKSLFFSAAVSSAALCVTVLLSSYSFAVYAPFLIAALVALGVSLFRLRGVRSGLPLPYGKGTVTRIDARRTARDGLLMVFGTLLLTVALFGSVFVASPTVLFFPVAFGLMLGLPLSEVIFFGLTARLESLSGSRIFLITEETTEEGKAVLVKSIELKPASEKKGRALASGQRPAAVATALWSTAPPKSCRSS